MNPGRGRGGAPATRRAADAATLGWATGSRAGLRARRQRPESDPALTAAGPMTMNDSTEAPVAANVKQLGAILHRAARVEPRQSAL
eukprot:scaffold23111_cov117-Isochrysis_galbana.AAC.4